MKLYKNIILKYGLGIVILVAFIGLINYFTCFSLKISGITVPKEEFQMLILQNKTKILSQYTMEEVNTKNFWVTSIQNSTPLELLITQTLDQLKYYKAIQILAQEKNIGFNSSFKYLKSLWLQNEKTKNNAYSSNEIAYGPETMDFIDYYNFQHSNLQVQLEEILKRENTVSEQALKEIYNNNQDLYKYDTGVTVLVAESSYHEHYAMYDEIQLTLQQNTTINDLRKQFPQINFYEIEMNNFDTKEGKSGVYLLRWQIAKNLQEKEVSKPFQIDNNILIMRCEKKVENGIETFENVKSVLQSQVETMFAQNVIVARKESLTIKANQNQLQKAALEILN